MDKVIIGLPCTQCSRPTNHEVVSTLEDSTEFNLAKVKCMSCDNTFGVKYGKGEVPNSNSQRIIFPKD